MRGRRLVRARRIATTASLAVLLIGCGSPAPASGVVTLDSPGASGSPGAAAASPSDDYSQQLLAYSQCMRSHGFPNFPDPEVSGGQVRLPNLSGTGIDPKTDAFRSADTACQSLMPTPPPQARQPMSPVDQAKWLAFAQCVRDHGVANFPDPDFSNGGPKPMFDFNGTGIDGRSTTVQAAQNACRPLLPVIAGGAGASPSPSGAAQP